MLEWHDWPNFFQVSTIWARAREKGKEPSSVVLCLNSLPLPFRTPATQAICIHAICSNIDDRQETERGCVTAVQFILFNFANYSPSIVMELKVSKEITCKCQSQRFETNKHDVSWALTLFLKLQIAEINFEKLLGWTVFKNPNFNPFQSSSVLPIRGICCICCMCYFNPASVNVLSGYFYVFLLGFNFNGHFMMT